MEKQITLERECLATLRATKWTFTSMTSHVINEVLFAGEWFRANVAAMGSLSCVLAQVISQMFFASKRFAAELTAMWRITCVDTHMIGQVLLARK